MSFAVIVNARAGGRGVPLDEIRAALAAAGVEADLQVTEGSLDDMLRERVASGATVLGVAGGDGSARSAARVLAGTSTALAVFPTGTLNHFARSVGIDSIEAAARAVAGGRIRPIAVGYVDDEPFLNTATFGLYADVVRRRDRMRRWLGKWPAALVAFNVTIARYRPLRLMLSLGDTQIERRTALVGVGVSRRSFPVSEPPPRLEREPELVLSILRARTRRGLLAAGFRTALRVLTRGPADAERDAEILEADAFELSSTSHRLGVTVDGEVVRRGNALRVRLERDALRVVVPES